MSAWIWGTNQQQQSFIFSNRSQWRMSGRFEQFHLKNFREWVVVLNSFNILFNISQRRMSGRLEQFHVKNLGLS